MLILWSNLSLDTVATPANVVISGIDQTNSVGDVTATGKAAVSITGIDQTNAVGDVAVIALKNKSGVNRQWLIEYYTKAFEKVPQNTKLTVPAKKYVKVAHKEINAARADREFQLKLDQWVLKAEREIELLMSSMAQARERDLFLAELQQMQVKLPRSEDFTEIAKKMRRKLKEDDELMLFSMVL